MNKGVYFATLTLCFFACCIFPVSYQEINPVLKAGEDYGTALAHVFLPALMFAFPASIACAMMPMLAPMRLKPLLLLWIAGLASLLIAIYTSFWDSVEAALSGNEVVIFILYGLRFTIPPALCIAAAVISLLSIEPQK